MLFNVQLKLNCSLKKPTCDGIEAKKFYIQLSFERYKGKLVLCFSSPSVYVLVMK